MTTNEGSHPAPRGIAPAVTLLNVDLEIYGEIDRAVLLQAFGEDVCVLHDDGENPLVLELNDDSDETLATKLSGFVALVRALPANARAAWDSAQRRVFDIGIQSGLGPHSTTWKIPSEVVASLAEIGAEVALTIYGADRIGTSLV